MESPYGGSLCLPRRYAVDGGGADLVADSVRMKRATSRMIPKAGPPPRTGPGPAAREARAPDPRVNSGPARPKSDFLTT